MLGSIAYIHISVRTEEVGAQGPPALPPAAPLPRIPSVHTPRGGVTRGVTRARRGGQGRAAPGVAASRGSGRLWRTAGPSRPGAWQANTPPPPLPTVAPTRVPTVHSRGHGRLNPHPLPTVAPTLVPTVHSRGHGRLGPRALPPGRQGAPARGRELGTPRRRDRHGRAGGAASLPSEKLLPAKVTLLSVPAASALVLLLSLNRFTFPAGRSPGHRRGPHCAGLHGEHRRAVGPPPSY